MTEKLHVSSSKITYHKYIIRYKFLAYGNRYHKAFKWSKFCGIKKSSFIVEQYYKRANLAATLEIDSW